MTTHRPRPYKCLNCQRPTGLKPVTKVDGRVGKLTYYGVGEPELRASCRFCGHVREEARA